MIRRSLTESLTDAGYDLTGSAAGMPALDLILHNHFDVVLLDLGLPDVEGSTLLSMIRAVSAVPILVITARGREDEIIKTLNLGADDYVTKPFAAAHLDARIRAVLRRADRTPPPSIRIGSLIIDTRLRTVTIDGREVELRKLEFQLLLILALADQQVVAAAELAHRLWGDASADTLARLDVHLSLLRTQLGESAKAPRFLQRVRGVGIRLSAPEN